MPVVIKCQHCEHESRMTESMMLDALQGHGMLKRDSSPDHSLLRELLNSIADRISCKDCHKKGVTVEDDWQDDWDDEVRCQGCNSLIPPERLEIFPDSKYCPACQSKAEQGGSPGEEAEYCYSCGGLMRIARRGGQGLAGYSMVCSDCGKRG